MALNPPSRSAVITGVSSGIGWGTAKALIARGYRVFGSVRKQADADRVRSELGELFTPLLFDVTDAAAIAKAREQVEASLAGKGLACLVNNSGIGVGGPVLEQPLDEFKRHFDVKRSILPFGTRSTAALSDTRIRRSSRRSLGSGNSSSPTGVKAMAPRNSEKKSPTSSSRGVPRSDTRC